MRLQRAGAPDVVLVDTVGFIRHLPHRLVAAFRATLEETREASLLLHVLGVHRDDAFAEFLRTNDAPTQHILERQSLPRMEAHFGNIDPEAIRNLMGVLPEYIATYWSEVERDHGSVDAYLAQTLGVDDARKARLRERLLT